MYLQYGDNIRAYNDYHEAKEEAKKQGLLLAEYGNMYGSNMVYAYWNETGNRNDDEKIIAYYKFNDNDDSEPISEKEFKDYIYR